MAVCPASLTTMDEAGVGLPLAFFVDNGFAVPVVRALGAGAVVLEEDRVAAGAESRVRGAALGAPGAAFIVAVGRPVTGARWAVHRCCLLRVVIVPGYPGSAPSGVVR